MPDRSFEGEGQVLDYQMFGIRDPNTGFDDAFCEVWLLGLHDPDEEMVANETIAACKTASSHEADDVTRQEAIMSVKSNAFELVLGWMKHLPQSSQFLTIGSTGVAAVGVSYARPRETRPRQHPSIDGIVSGLIGADYLTYHIKRFDKSTKPKGNRFSQDDVL